MNICDQEVTPNIAAKKFWQEQLEVGLTNICTQEFDYQTGEDYKKARRKPWQPARMLETPPSRS